MILYENANEWARTQGYANYRVYDAIRMFNAAKAGPTPLDVARADVAQAATDVQASGERVLGLIDQRLAELAKPRPWWAFWR